MQIDNREACEAVEGLLAVAAYEPLDVHEQASLDAHLQHCAACAELARDFAHIAERLPAESLELETDLLPAIRGELIRSSQRSGWRMRVAGTIAALAACVALVVGLSTGAPQIEPAQTVAQAPKSQLARTIGQAERLIEARFYSRAYVLLAEAAESAPDDPRAGEALQAAADIAFLELHWYPEAHDAYRTLRAQYTDIFAGAPETRIRLEMLNEAAADPAYGPLRALDAARASGEFERYEAYISRYAGTYLADAAVDQMAVGFAEMLGAEASRADALEHVASQCTDPVAASQVKLALARALANPDSERARALLTEVAAGDHPAITAAASDVLTSLDGTRARR